MLKINNSSAYVVLPIVVGSTALTRLFLATKFEFSIVAVLTASLSIVAGTMAYRRLKLPYILIEDENVVIYGDLYGKEVVQMKNIIGVDSLGKISILKNIGSEIKYCRVDLDRMSRLNKRLFFIRMNEVVDDNTRSKKVLT